MLTGQFSVAGWFMNLVPGCSVLPLVEVCPVEEQFSITGSLTITPDGKITGQMADTWGPSSIEGEVAEGEVRFRKQYTRGDLVRQAPVHYQLKPTDDPMRFLGEYRFVEHQGAANGRAALWLTPL